MALTDAELVTELYIGYFGRAPDPQGLNYWVSALGRGVSLASVADLFATSSETIATYPFLSAPNLANAATLVNEVYANLLNRAPDAPGLSFWVEQLTSGRVSVSGFVLTIENSVNMQVGTADARTLADKTTVGLDYATRLEAAGKDYTQASAHDVINGVTDDPATVAAGEAKTTAFISPPPVITGPFPPLVLAGHTLDYTEHQPATAVDIQIHVLDVDSATLVSASVNITSHFVSGEDVLAFVNQNGIAGSFDAATGTLTLTGTASVAAYQTALASVTYFNSSDNPSGLDRTVSFAVNDGGLDSNLRPPPSRSRRSMIRRSTRFRARRA
jgi:hypothetical protein